MGLFGNESAFGIASVGIIVFNADRCRDGIIEPSEEIDSDDATASESSASRGEKTETDGEFTHTISEFTTFEPEDKKVLPIDQTSMYKLLAILIGILILLICLTVCTWRKKEVD